MNIFAKFKRNEDAINNGRLMITGYDDDGKPVGVMVARIHESNTKYATHLTNLRKTRQAELDRIRKVDEEKFQEIIGKLTEDAICDICIVGYVGLTDENGKKLEATPETARRIKDDLPELFDKIVVFGVDATNYVGEFDENESVKN